MGHRVLRWAIVLPVCAAAVQSNPDVQTIVDRSIQATRRDWNEYPKYSFQETDKDNHGSKTYAVSMILGSPYRRLIAVNGHALSGQAQLHQEQLMRKAIAKRRAESNSQRASRTAEYEKERHRDQQMMLEITKAFDFTSAGEATIDSHQVFVLQATPKPGYQPPNLETKALTGMEGTLWVDTQSYQWVKVQASVIHPVSIAGFLARVMPGTKFQLEKTPVADGLWFPSRFSMHSRAKVIGFTVHRAEEQSFSNYTEAPASP